MDVKKEASSSSSSSSSTSADVVSSIDELLLEILSRVPAKTLARSKLVSKRWESLIAAHHVSLLRKQGPLGLICTGKRIPSFEFIPLRVGGRAADSPFSELRFPWGLTGGLHSITQSCNGLLLCCSAFSSDLDPNSLPANVRAFCVWLPEMICSVYNPTTKLFARIPRPAGYPRMMLGLNLAYDPAKSPGYKVLFIYKVDSLVQIEIYSSESGAWRLHDKPFSAEASFEHGVYWNGSINWINRWGKQLLYFNLDKEEVHTVSLPPAFIVPRDAVVPLVGYFGESGDHLHVIEMCANMPIFNVYEMKRDYSGWFVRYRVDLTDNTNILDDRYRIISLVRGEEGKCWSYLFFLEATGKLKRWNLDHNIVEEAFDNQNIMTERRYYRPDAFEYIESLAIV